MSSVLEETTQQIQADKRIVRKAGSFFLNPESIPWTPFVFPDTWFKLLNVNAERGSMTLILRAGKDAPTPLHKHIGAAEIFVLKGSFAYEEGSGSSGDYVYEAGGVVHIAEAGEEVEAYVIFHGPLVGFDDAGNVTGIMDADLILDLAKANGAAGHIEAARAAVASSH